MKHSAFGCLGAEANVPGRPLVCPPGCRKHLTATEHDTEAEDHLLWQARIRMLTRTEQMIAVGCKFGPNDLADDQWRDLIILAEERQAMDTRVRDLEERLRKEQQKADDAAAAARKQAGIPPPGTSLFAGKPKP